MIYDMIWHMIRYDTMWYDMIWYDIWYDMIWYDTIWYIWYDTKRYDMIWYDVIWYDTIYLTAIGLSSGGSSTVHIYTKTVHRTTQSTQTIHRTTQFTSLEECVPCPVFAKYTLAFALQLRKKHGNTSIRVGGQCQLARWKQNIQNRAYITIGIYTHNNKNA